MTYQCPECGNTERFWLCGTATIDVQGLFVQPFDLRDPDEIELAEEPSETDFDNFELSSVSCAVCGEEAVLMDMDQIIQETQEDK